MIIYFSISCFALFSLIVFILLLIPFKIKGKLKINGENNRYAQFDLNYFFKSINFSYKYNFNSGESMSFHLLGFDMIGEE